MELIKKIHSLITGYKTIDVEGAELWVVSWNARYGDYYTSTERAAKAFFTEEDAKTFVKSLKDAQELLNYTENLDIRIQKQK